MPSFVAALPFVLLTIICWGNYGPLMHEGQHHMHSALRAFIGVGFAYFLIAVLVPGAMLKLSGEKGGWTRDGAMLSLLAGAVGALGALGVIMAFTFKGKAVYVMPLVFGGAPIVNTIVTMALAQNYGKVSKLFLTGIVIAALGAAGVLVFKPAAVEAAPAAQQAAGEVAEVAAPAEEGNFPLIIASIATAVLCWGSYGPVLHKGQMKMGGSRMRPFLCVGISYFVIAVAMPLLILPVTSGYGDWTSPEMIQGLWWSLAGGAAGALGALGIILAFNFGGKPIFVMPLVFGLAPVMNTITTVTAAASWGRIGPEFIAALLVTITGAVLVLVYAPKPLPAAKSPSAPDVAAPAGKPA